MTAVVPASTYTLPALVDRAVSALANARTAAEVLEARDLASIAYDAAKRAARFGLAKRAHDDLIAAAYRAQADALAIEAEAKRRLADEYDAAQQRGEVASKSPGRPKRLFEKKSFPATTADIGLTHTELHEARMIRDAEEADLGVVRRTADAAVAAGEEPTKAKVKRAVKQAAKKAKPKVRYSKAPQSVDPEPRHEVDLRRLEVAWTAACASARAAFLDTLSDRRTEAA